MCLCIASLAVVATVRAEGVTAKADRVKKAKDLLSAGRVYHLGCSEFICEVLGIPQEDANSIMKDATVVVGDNGKYDFTKLKPGDIVGRVHDGHGHVAVYVGPPSSGQKPFIDVQDVDKKPRDLSSYGDDFELRKCSKY